MISPDFKDTSTLQRLVRWPNSVHEIVWMFCAQSK